MTWSHIRLPSAFVADGVTADNIACMYWAQTVHNYKVTIAQILSMGEGHN